MPELSTGCGQLRTTMSLRGPKGRGNLLALAYEIIAVRIEVSIKMFHTLNTFVFQDSTRRLPRRRLWAAPRNDILLMLPVCLCVFMIVTFMAGASPRPTVSTEGVR